MDGWIAKRISDIACEAYASDVSPHNLNPAALTELVYATVGGWGTLRSSVW